MGARITVGNKESLRLVLALEMGKVCFLKKEKKT